MDATWIATRPEENSCKKSLSQISSASASFDWVALQVALSRLDHSPQNFKASVGRSGALSNRRRPSRSSRASSRASAESINRLEDFAGFEEDLVVPKVVNIEVHLENGSVIKNEKPTGKVPTSPPSKRETRSVEDILLDLRESQRKYEQRSYLSENKVKRFSTPLLSNSTPLLNFCDRASISSEDILRNIKKTYSKEAKSEGHRTPDLLDDHSCPSLTGDSTRLSSKERLDNLESSSETEVHISDRESIADSGIVNRRTVIKISQKSNSASNLDCEESNAAAEWVRNLPNRRSLRTPKELVSQRVSSTEPTNENASLTPDFSGGISVSIRNPADSCNPIRRDSTSRMYVRQGDTENRPTRASAFNVRRTIEKRQIQQERRERKVLREQIREHLRSLSEGRRRIDSSGSSISSGCHSSSSLRSKSLSSLDQDQDDYRSESPLFKAQSSPTLESEKEGIRTYLFGSNLGHSSPPRSSLLVSRIMSPCLSENSRSELVQSPELKYFPEKGNSISLDPILSSFKDFKSTSKNSDHIASYRISHDTDRRDLSNNIVDVDTPINKLNSNSNHISSTNSEINHFSNISSICSNINSKVNNIPNTPSTNKNIENTKDNQQLKTHPTESNRLPDFSPVPPPRRRSRVSRSTGQLTVEKEEKPAWLRLAKERSSLRSPKTVSDNFSDRSSTVVIPEPEWVTKARKKLESMNVCLTSVTDAISVSSQVTDSSAWSRGGLDALEDLREEVSCMSEGIEEEATEKVMKELGIVDRGRTTKMIEFPKPKTSRDASAERLRVSFDGSATQNEKPKKLSQPSISQKDEVRFGDLKHDWGGVQKKSSRTINGKHKETRFGEIHFSDNNLDSKQEDNLPNGCVSTQRTMKKEPSTLEVHYMSNGDAKAANGKNERLPVMHFGDTPQDIFTKSVSSVKSQSSSKFESIAGPDPTKMTAEELNQNVEEYDFPIPTGKEDATELINFLKESLNRQEIVPEFVSDEDSTPKPKSILKRKSIENSSPEPKLDEESKPNENGSQHHISDSREATSNIDDDDHNDTELLKIRTYQPNTFDESHINSLNHPHTKLISINAEDNSNLKPSSLKFDQLQSSQHINSIQSSKMNERSTQLMREDSNYLSSSINTGINSSSTNVSAAFRKSSDQRKVERPLMNSSSANSCVAFKMSNEDRKIERPLMNFPSANTCAAFQKPSDGNKIEPQSMSKTVPDIDDGCQLNGKPVKKEQGDDPLCVRRSLRESSRAENKSHKRTQSSALASPEIVDLVSKSTSKKPNIQMYHPKTSPEQRKKEIFHHKPTEVHLEIVDVSRRSLPASLEKKKDRGLLFEWEAIQRQRIEDEEKNKINTNICLKPVSSKIKDLVKNHSGFMSMFSKDRKAGEYSGTVDAKEEIFFQKIPYNKPNTNVPLIDNMINPMKSPHIVQNVLNPNLTKEKPTKKIPQYSSKSFPGRLPSSLERETYVYNQRNIYIDNDTIQRQRMKEKKTHLENIKTPARRTEKKVEPVEIKHRVESVETKPTEEPVETKKETYFDSNSIPSIKENPFIIQSKHVNSSFSNEGLKSPHKTREWVNNVLNNLPNDKKPLFVAESQTDSKDNLLSIDTRNAPHRRSFHDRLLRKNESEVKVSSPKRQTYDDKLGLVAAMKSPTVKTFETKHLGKFPTITNEPNSLPSSCFSTPLTSPRASPERLCLRDNLDSKNDSVSPTNEKENVCPGKVRQNLDFERPFSVRGNDFFNGETSSPVSKESKLLSPSITSKNLMGKLDPTPRSFSKLMMEWEERGGKERSASPASYSEGTAVFDRWEDYSMGYPHSSRPRRERTTSLRSTSSVRSTPERDSRPVSLSSILERDVTSPYSSTHRLSVSEELNEITQNYRKERASKKLSSEKKHEIPKYSHSEETSAEKHDISKYSHTGETSKKHDISKYSHSGKTAPKKQEISKYSHSGETSSKKDNIATLKSQKSNERNYYQHLSPSSKLDRYKRLNSPAKEFTPSPRTSRRVTKSTKDTSAALSTNKAVSEKEGKTKHKRNDSKPFSVYTKYAPKDSTKSKVRSIRRKSSLRRSRSGDSTSIASSKKDLRTDAKRRGNKEESLKQAERRRLDSDSASERYESIRHRPGGGYTKTSVRKVRLGDGDPSEKILSTREKDKHLQSKYFKQDASVQLEKWAAGTEVQGKLVKKEGQKYSQHVEEEVDQGGKKSSKAVSRRVVRKGSRRLAAGGEIVSETKEMVYSGDPSEKNGQNNRSDKSIVACTEAPTAPKRKIKSSTDGERYVTQSVCTDKGIKKFTTEGVDNKTIKSVEVIGGSGWGGEREVTGRHGERVIMEHSVGLSGRPSTVMKKATTHSKVIITKTKKTHEHSKARNW